MKWTFINPRTVEWRPRCIHLHHIRGYAGIVQKVGYVFRRFMGLDTPSADMVGCEHDSRLEFFNTIVPLPEMTNADEESTFRFPNGCVIEMDISSAYPDMITKDMTGTYITVPFDMDGVEFCKNEDCQICKHSPEKTPMSIMSLNSKYGLNYTDEAESVTVAKDTTSQFEHYIIDFGDWEYRCQLRYECELESLASGKPVELHFHHEYETCQATAHVCERYIDGKATAFL